MTISAIQTNPFLLEQIRSAIGTQEYLDFITYSNTPEEKRNKLNRNVARNYQLAVRVINKMESYGEKRWWVLENSETTHLDKKTIELRRKVRVYFQVFDCGLDVMLLPQGQLINDINDLLLYTGKTVTSWILTNSEIFITYRNYLKNILDSDADFQHYLKKYNSE